MELIYIWSRKYKIFEDVEFNFSHKYKFQFDENSNELKIIEQNNKIKNFYMEENIDSISIIVGDNGSGKTTVCSFLFDVFINDTPLEYIIVYEIDGSLQIKYFILPQKINENDFQQYILMLSKIELLKDERIKYFKDSYKLESNEYYLVKNETSTLISIFKEAGIIEKIIYPDSITNYNNGTYFDIIYYSPHFTSQHFLYTIQNNNHKFFDISTAHLLSNDSIYYYNERTGIKYEEVRIDNISAHKIKDNKRIINFLLYYLSNEDINFVTTLPQGIMINIDENDLNMLKNEFKKSGNEEELILKIEEKAKKEISKVKSYKKKFIIRLAIATLYNFLRSYLSAYKGIDETKMIISNKIFEIVKDNLIDKRSSVIVSCINIFNAINKSTIEIDKKTTRINLTGSVERANLIQFVNDNLNNKYFENEYTLFFSVTKNKELLLKFIEFYFNTDYITEYLKFTLYPYVSAGEISILTFYSRIFEIFNNDKELSDNIIIFLDEVETTLHPSLQKRIIYDTINFLSLQEKKKYKIYIIFATHSPIILSDVQSENCIFIEKNNSKCIVRDLSGINTFGANIHTLLRHPFFMKSGIIGSFAEKKIYEMMKILEKHKVNKDDIEYCKSIVELIGEPIIKKLITLKIRLKLQNK